MTSREKMAEKLERLRDYVKYLQEYQKHTL